ncbi:MAG: DNA polymerase I [Tissierellia bacterium]|nr:DNA polymerase I [Tissierellia bacterium]
MSTFLVIDGSSLVNRAFYALPPLTNRKGIQTNAIFGFVRMFDKLLEEYEPSHVAILFDPKGPTFRHDLYDDYKGTRMKFPPELSYQITLLKDLLGKRGFAIVEQPGMEADDMAGSLSRAFGDGLDILLVTGDRDYLQLVNEHTKVLYTRRGISDTILYDEAKVEEEYGMNPQALIELKALMGDSSDNIPGVAGVGEKTGTKLIQQFGTLEEIYDHLDEVKGKALKEKLTDQRDMAFLSRDLGRIKCDCPVEEGDFYLPKEADEDGLQEIYRDLEFKEMIEEEELPSAEAPEFLFLEEEKLLQELPNIVKDGKNISCKVFFRHSYHREEPFAFGIMTDKAYLVKDPKAVEKFYEKLKDVDLIGWEIKEDQYYLIHRRHFEGNPYYFDVSLAAYLLDPTQSTDALQSMYKKYYGTSAINHQDLLSAHKKKAIDEFSEEELGGALASSLHQIQCLHGKQAPLLTDLNMDHLFRDIEMPLTEVLAQMESVGFKMESDFLYNLGEEFSKDLDSMEKKIHQLAGEEFNIQSPKQLSHILFEKLELPVIKKTKTGYSTDQEVLEKLAAEHELPELILGYRQDSKLKSTYVDGMLDLIDEDGRLRTTFQQTKTATGRISSTEPNLQNIPMRTEKGRVLRKAFVAEEGYVLFDLDYSQIELRVLAAVSGEEKMIQGFEGALDIHRQTASEVFDVPYEEVTKTERSHAKAVNFGIVYGISDYGLSRNLNIGRKQAAEYIKNYFEKFPAVKAYMDRIIEQAKEDGYVETLLHRRRYIPELSSRNFNIRSFGERVALNTPIQGTAADIIKLAMVQVYQYLKEHNLKSRLILTIHDELILEVPEEEVNRIQGPVEEIMTHVLDMGVTLKVDGGISKNWYEA